MERCPAHITAWALIYAAEWGDAVICARGENTHSHLVMGSSSVQWHSPSPSGFIYNPVGVTHEHYTWLSSFLLVSLDLWPSKSKIIGWHWMSFISRVRGAKLWRRRNAGKWVKTEGMHDVMPRVGAAESLQPSFHLCIFITGASLPSYVWSGQALVYTALAKSCNL